MRRSYQLVAFIQFPSFKHDHRIYIYTCYLCFIISYHIISYHIISYHIILYHIISYHIILYHIISYHIISYYIISYCIILYHIISYYIIFSFTSPLEIPRAPGSPIIPSWCPGAWWSDCWRSRNRTPHAPGNPGPGNGGFLWPVLDWYIPIEP